MARPSRSERCGSCFPTSRSVRGLFSDVGSPSSPPGRPQGWPLSYPPAQGKKRALLCGVRYVGKRYELKGTENDVEYMKYFLTNKFDYPEECILVLTESKSDPNLKPTKENMRSAMRWLVANVQSGDSLVFHFSGHGSQRVDDNSNEEKDGFDETLCPLDYELNGMILDDEINETIVRPLPRGAMLHAIVDACHSGTVLDLPFLCRINRAGYYQWEDHSPPCDKGTRGGLAICISGCADNQTSADTTALTGNATTGAMTYSLIYAFQNEPGLSYGRLLTTMRSVIRGANTSSNSKLNGPVGSLVRQVLSFGLRQEPQLSSSEKFDINRKKFLL